MQTPLLAHAVGVRADLPVPLWSALVGGGLAVVVAFAALGRWAPRLCATQPLAGAQQRTVDGALTVVLRVLVLLAALAVALVALVGPTETTFNLAPYAFYVTFWVGLVPVSLLLGPLWRRVSPLRTLHGLLAALTGPPPGRLGRVGLWPATGVLLAYAWLELVYPDRALPRILGALLVGYAVLQLVAALWFGPDWFAAADVFEVYATLLGRLSPVGRRPNGALVLRVPLAGAVGRPTEPGLAAFGTVLVGTTAYDGVSRTSAFLTRYANAGLTVATAALLLTVLAVAGLYAGACALTSRLAGRPGAAAAYAHSVLPIAAGYAVAHYFSLLVFEGQLTAILASNPFAQEGVDLFGIYRRPVDLTVVSPHAIAAVQVGAIVVGHLLGVLLAHDTAVRRGDRRAAQYPLLAAMVALTLAGLVLLLG